MTPQQAIEQFETLTGLTIHAVTDRDGVLWWRRSGGPPVFECTVGDRHLHIDELSDPAYAAVPADLPADQQDAWGAVARAAFADQPTTDDAPNPPVVRGE